MLAYLFAALVVVTRQTASKCSVSADGLQEEQYLIYTKAQMLNQAQ